MFKIFLCILSPKFKGMYFLYFFFGTHFLMSFFVVVIIIIIIFKSSENQWGPILFGKSFKSRPFKFFHSFFFISMIYALYSYGELFL